jgi:hypothetical protein|uniref:Uncharacterized protein n=1 Tax=Picea glauca TaxID=3330 RepID=A0A101LVD2_PICGL|nr:hypothetical protein ABT39_MTgene2192 [Picea glauca]
MGLKVVINCIIYVNIHTRAQSQPKTPSFLLLLGRPAVLSLPGAAMDGEAYVKTVFSS